MTTRTLTAPAACAALLLAASASAQASVWRVASDGDVILVAPGGYAPFRVSGKGLRLHGPGAVVFNTEGNSPVETVLIEGTAAQQAVVLDGLQMVAFAPGSPSTVHVDGCAGPVWLSNAFIDSYGAAALHVEGSASVVLERCVLQTNLTTPSALGEPQPQPGARVDGGARLFAYDTVFQGSHGPLVLPGGPALVAPEDGGAGLLLDGAEARLYGCKLSGGNGNSLLLAGCLLGGDGGDGALLVSSSGTPPALFVTGGAAQPAQGGPFDPGCAPPSAPGAPFDVQAGALQQSGAVPRLLGIDPAAPPSGAEVHLALEGVAGDLFLLFASGAAAPGVTLPFAGTPFGLDLHLAPAPLVLVHASPLSSPHAAAVLTAPALPPDLAAATPALQGLFVDALGAPHAAQPRALTVLAP